MLDDFLHNVAKSHALIVVSLDLLLEFFGASALDVLAENFELFIAFQNFVFKLSDLLFEGHYQESFLLIFLSGLGERQQGLIGVRLVLLVRLLYKLVMREKILNGLLLPRQLIL